MAEQPQEPSTIASSQGTGAAPGSHDRNSGNHASVSLSESEAKKCWICFGDSNEDVPGTASPWRTPCPCALTAHEACLLDWIADLEAPPTSASQIRSQKKRIECPQCKAEIRVARPWSPVVAGVRAVERITGTFILPGVASLFVGGVLSACYMHGALSLILVMGRREVEDIVDSVSNSGAAARVRLLLGLPMVPVVLVLSRTRLADGILPILPLVFLAPHLDARQDWYRFLQITGRSSASGAGSLAVGYRTPQLWPPSPATAFAALPYLRAVYNAGYAHFFAKKEREWMKAVQRDPRPGEPEIAQPDVADAIDIDARVDFRAEIMFGDDDDVDEDALRAAINAAAVDGQDNDAAVGAQAQANDGEDNAGVLAQDAAPQQQQERQQQQPQRRRQQQQQQQQRQDRHHQHNGLVLSAGKIIDKVLGALCFPAIASVMGEMLRLGLPARLTASSLSENRKPGLLQTKWGRSIVGGCLFVVVKDALVLYSRYRLAVDHKKRRVLDYKGPSVRSSTTA